MPVYIDHDIRAVREMHHQQIAVNEPEDCVYTDLVRQADTLLQAHQAGNPAVIFHLACWCPGLVGRRDDIMASTLTQQQARESMAREHGFADWAEVESITDRRHDLNFEQAVSCVINGQVKALEAKLKETPTLPEQTSAYGHRATLLHYLGANGIESHRQITPSNAADVAQCLLDHGSDVNSLANIYGGSRVLGLVLTSAHPANAGVTDKLAAVLRSAGAIE